MVEFILALIGALSLSSIPLLLGWRRTADEAVLARRLGIVQGKKKWDPDQFALRTGTGLRFNQIAMGFLAWVAGSFFAGLALGFAAAILFAAAGGLLYAGTLSDRRQEFSIQQARDILRALSVVQTLLKQGKPLLDAWAQAAGSVGPAGQMVLSDLVRRLRGCTPSTEGATVRAWSQAWDNPAVDIVATVLYSYYTLHVQVTPLIENLRTTLSAVVEILSRARAAAKGVEWQAKFLAVFPPLVLVLIGLTTPQAGRIYARSPLYLMPVLLGSALSYWLSMRMVRDGLSIEASMGLQEQGSIPVEQMGSL